MDDKSGDDDKVNGEVSRDMTGEADGMNQLPQTPYRSSALDPAGDCHPQTLCKNFLSFLAPLWWPRAATSSLL